RVVSGIHDIYGSLFDELGYAKVIKNPKRYKSVVDIYKNIVLARIANPVSKKASIDMLEEDFGISINLDKVYRMMDKIDSEAIERLNDITYENTLNLFNQKVDVIFFDCTTIYFEAFEEDDLRRNGYSKDLKFNQPQILLALMVTREGLPIGYKVFEGDKYEGHTLIPMIKEIRQKHKINKVIIVSDAGMFGRNNLEELENLEGNGIEYIVGARLKNMPEDIKEEILDTSKYREISSGYKVMRLKYQGKDLIVSYSEKRAKKDARDRLKAIESLKKKLSKNKSPNNYLSCYGYKRYLKVSNKIRVEIDEEKVLNDSRWDGVGGIITNAKDISDSEILEQYNNLWNVENAFRITKHDLKVRPVFHWKPTRVMAHVAISFTAYTLVKHLEYRVKLQYKKLSCEKIRQILIKAQTSILFDKVKKIRYGLPSRISQEAGKIYKLMRREWRLTPYIIKKM
ncbi:MAG: IS1634 family transposase, partial [Elusimicrobiales bacterium]|nr:IS1634 family transposase [Elusimicrobiales bacterium]